MNSFFSVFDLSENGCNFKIKVERQGEYPTYVSSRFASPTSIDGLDEDGISQLLESPSDLESVFPVKSYDELKEVLNEHFYCNSSASVPSSYSPKKQVEKKPEPVASGVSDDVDPLDDDKVKELLDGLGD